VCFVGFDVQVISIIIKLFVLGRYLPRIAETCDIGRYCVSRGHT